MFSRQQRGGGGQDAVPPQTVRSFAGHGHAADRVAAIIFLGLAVLLFSVSLGYGLFQGARPGPGLYPALITAALLVVSLVWLITGAGKPGASRVVKVQESGRNQPVAEEMFDDDDPVDEQVPIDAAGARRIAFVVGWSVLPLLLLDSVGYLLTMTLYVAGLLIVIARVRTWLALPGAALGVLVTAYGADALGIVLPDPLHLVRLLGL